jgi:hypothetical protein
MLQIDHIYEFFYKELFKDLEVNYPPGGVIKTNDVSIRDISVFTPGMHTKAKIFFYDQEPFIINFAKIYMNLFDWQSAYPVAEHVFMNETNTLPHGIIPFADLKKVKFYADNSECLYKKGIVVVSEHSQDSDNFLQSHKFKKLYYFYHGFAALDWYRGYYALNYNKSIVKQYDYDFISFNRIINNDRSYRIYFVSLLKELELLDYGQISFNVTDNLFDDWRDEVSNPNSKLSEHAKHHAEQYLIDISKLIIDKEQLPGSASAGIPRTIDRSDSNNDKLNVDALWHIVTETVFYYDKLHLTEKIFKPIVSKQPFMLLAAPGNLAYLKSYGFKTFDSVIDESYDLIQDNDRRTKIVVDQLHWYCNLTPGEKIEVIKQLEPIIQHNFDHFYGEFRHIITRELLDNTKTLFKEIGYNDSHINYTNIHHVLTH